PLRRPRVPRARRREGRRGAGARAPAHPRAGGARGRRRQRRDRPRRAREDARPRMTTRRGRAVAVLGVVVYLAAWTFGSRALYPVSVGLVLVVVLASAWVRFSARPPQVRRHGLARDVV